MAEFISGLLDLGAQKSKGETASPPRPAQVTSVTNKITVQLTHTDLQKMVVRKLYTKAGWLKEFKTGALRVNPNGTFTAEFYK